MALAASRLCPDKEGTIRAMVLRSPPPARCAPRPPSPQSSGPPAPTRESDAAAQAGAVCGTRSLGSPLELTSGLPTVMMVPIRGWLPLWLPLIGSTLVLHSAQRLAPRLLPARRP